ncbi:branched-chain amino acid ABC transporter permease [Thermodesulfobacteriota bacterium]
MSIEEGNSKLYIREETEKRYNWLWFFLAMVALFCLPLFMDRYFTYLFNLVGIYIIIVVGFNILMGYAGQISAGHAAFVAVGAYTSTILVTRLNLSFIVALPLAGVTTSAVGLLVAIPALRLKGLYLAIATMGFGFIVDEAIIGLTGLTGGAGGLSVPKVTLFGYKIATDQSFSYLLYPIVIVLCLIAKSVGDHSKVGRALIAIRDSEPVAEAFGVSLTKYKIFAFILASFYAGVAGSLLAHYIGFIGPDNFTLMHSIEYIVMVIVGGMGSLAGAIMGTIFISLLPEVIRVLKDYLPHFLQQERELHLSVYAVIMLSFLIFEPAGMYGRWLRIKTYMKAFPFNKKKAHLFKKREIKYSSMIKE